MCLLVGGGVCDWKSGHKPNCPKVEGCDCNCKIWEKTISKDKAGYFGFCADDLRKLSVINISKLGFRGSGVQIWSEPRLPAWAFMSKFKLRVWGRVGRQRLFSMCWSARRCHIWHSQVHQALCHSAITLWQNTDWHVWPHWRVHGNVVTVLYVTRP